MSEKERAEARERMKEAWEKRMQEARERWNRGGDHGKKPSGDHRGHGKPEARHGGSSHGHSSLGSWMKERWNNMSDKE